MTIVPPRMTFQDYDRLFEQDWQRRNPLPEGLPQLDGPRFVGP